MNKIIFAFAIATAFLNNGCGNPASSIETDDFVHEVGDTLSSNITSGRASRYDPKIDYFPEKVSFRYAEQLQVEYHKNYKVLTIIPAANPAEKFRYVLVQRGTPPPDDYSDARVIEVPVKNFVITDNALLGAVELLGLHDRLLAISDFEGVTLPGVSKMIESGKLARVGGAGHTDVETVLALRPNLVVSYWSVDPNFNSYPALDQAGVKTVVLASHWETSPLAKAEWMKAIALLFNREKDAAEHFDQVAGNYEALTEKARNATQKPVVITLLPARNTWFLYPKKSVTQKFITDAGGVYFWNKSGIDEIESENGTTDFEAALQRGVDADYWIIDQATPIRKIEGLLSLDNRLSLFKAVQTGEVYNLDKQLDAQGNYAYPIQSSIAPDVVLADLIKILHPELMTDHQLVFYRKFDSPSQPLK